jgi:hypothetical protein
LFPEASIRDSMLLSISSGSRAANGMRTDRLGVEANAI